MTLEQLMNEFGTAIGSDVFADEGGVYHIEFDGVLMALMERAGENRVLVWSEVGQPPPDDAGFYRRLLEEMFLDRGTDGAVFSCDAETGIIYLHRSESLSDMELSGLTTLISSFAELSGEWRKRLAGAPGEGEALGGDNVVGDFLRV